MQTVSFPTTESQREIWTACQLGQDASLAYSESVTLVLRGAIEPAAMVQALKDLELRHESLRLMVADDGLMFSVRDTAQVTPEIIYLKDDSSALKRAQQAAVSTPFDLVQGPLFRASIIVGQDEHYVLITAHHMVCDGWSMAILMRDLGALYSARCAGGKESLELAEPPQFSAFANDEARYQESAAQQVDAEYWRNKFAAGAPIIDLPGDGTRPKLRSFVADRIDLTLPKHLVVGLKKVAAKDRASFFMALLSAYQILLWKILGSDGVVTAVPAAAQAVDGLFDLVGHCVNTLPILGSPSADQTFRSFLQRTRAAVLDAYEHQKTTFGRILQVVTIERDPSRIPLAPIIFNVDKKFESSDLKFKGLEATYLANPRIYEAFEIFINVAESNGQCTIECQFNTDLYSHAWITSHLNSFVALLEGVVGNADAPLKHLNWAPLAQLEEQYFVWNQQGKAPAAVTILEDIAANIAAHGAKTALICQGEALSYAELGEATNRWTRLLMSQGVGPGSFVGIALERSTRVLPILLAIMKAGAAYVPLDPEYPTERLSYMIAQTGCLLIVADPLVTSKMPITAGVRILLTNTPDLATMSSATVAPAPTITGDTLAYVIFTSGSTGLPKGVLVPHRGVVNLLHSIAQKPGFAATDTLLGVTTFSFDVSVAELFLPLMIGGTLVMASGDEVKDGRLLMQLIAAHKISFMPATPATWRMLLDSGWQGAALKAISTGEALPKDLASELLDLVESLWNFYGPTEVTVWATGDRVHTSDALTIGGPIAGTSVYVVDRYGMPVPRHMPGELYLGGLGVTQGYIGRPDLTDDRFLVLAGVPELTKVYKTGDLVRWRDDGMLDYLGRNDNQVKVRGYRIELGEIETVIAACPGLDQALLMVREDRVGDKRLVAYVEATANDVTEASVTSWCQARLPSYMVPQHVVVLAAMPLLPNGKVNRKALKAPTIDTSASGDDDEIRGDVEQQLAALWGELLGLDRVPATKSFYNLGGHSLLAMRMLAAAQKTFGVVITLRTLLEHNSVRALAKVIGKPDSTALEPIPQISDGKTARLSIIQERVYYLDLLNPNEIVNLLPDGRIIRGPFDASLFAQAVKTVIARHPLLRSIVVNDAAGPMMLVRDQVDFDLTPIDLTHLSPAEQEAYVRECGRSLASTPMDVHAENLFRLRLLKLADNVHVFATVFHHLIWDGWCFDIFWSELHQLYMAGHQGLTATLPEPGCRYLDFAQWHRQESASPEFLKQLPFWRDYLKGMVGLELTTDMPRPARKTSQGKRLTFFWDRRQTDLMQTLAQSEQTTTFVVMLTMFKYLLSLYSGQRDIVVGTPVQGRGHPDFANVIGYFVNTLVLRSDVSTVVTFRQMLQKVKASAENAFRHQDIAFEDIVKALDLKPEPSRTTLYTTMFAYQDTSNRPTDWGPLAMEQISLPQDVVGTDLVLWVRKSAAGISGGMDYRTDLFSEERMATMIKHLTLLLETLTIEPERPIFAQPVLLPEAVISNQDLAPAPAAHAADLLDMIIQSAKRHGAEAHLIAAGQVISGHEFLAILSQIGRESGAAAMQASPPPAGNNPILSHLSTLVAAIINGSPIASNDGPIQFDREQDAKLVQAMAKVITIPERVFVPSTLMSHDDHRWLVLALTCGAVIEFGDVARDNPYTMALQVQRWGNTLFHLSVDEAANILATGGTLSTGHIVVSGGVISPLLASQASKNANLSCVFGPHSQGMWCAIGAPQQAGTINWRSLGPALVITPRLTPSYDQQGAGLFLAGQIRTHSGDLWLGTAYTGFIGDKGLVILGRQKDEALHGVHVRRPEEQVRALLACPGVINVHGADVNDQTGQTGQTRASIVVAATMDFESLATLKAKIKNRVPQYLMFDQVNFLEMLPLGPDGLVARAHPLLAITTSERDDGDEPQTPAERAMAAIWRRILATKRVCLHDNFFDLGGYSLLPLLVINEVEQKTGVRLEIAAFLTQNLKSIAAQSGFTAGSAADYEVLP